MRGPLEPRLTGLRPRPIFGRRPVPPGRNRHLTRDWERAPTVANHSTAAYLRTLGLLLHLLALLLVTGAVLEVVATAWPPRPSLIQWRFGFEGLAAQGVPVTVLGFYLALVAAVLRRQRVGLALLGVLAGLAGAALLALTVVFALDAVQTFGALRLEVVAQVTLANVRAATLDLFGAVLLLVQTVLCFRARRWLKPAGPALIVGQTEQAS